jgi:hypothetical protein
MSQSSSKLYITFSETNDGCHPFIGFRKLNHMLTYFSASQKYYNDRLAYLFWTLENCSLEFGAWDFSIL